MRPERIPELERRVREHVMAIVHRVLQEGITERGLTYGDTVPSREQRIAIVLDRLTRPRADGLPFWLAYAMVAPHFAKADLLQLQRDLHAERHP